MTLEGPGGVFATVRVEEIGQDTVTLETVGHRISARSQSDPSTPRGPLSPDSCTKCITACHLALALLNKYGASIPGGIEVLSALADAERAFSGEIAAIQGSSMGGARKSN